jgi:hypothetical protein
MKICAPTLFGPVIATVIEDEGALYWDTKPGEDTGTGGDLCFDEDDRHCWTTTGAWNKRGLRKVAPHLA